MALDAEKKQALLERLKAGREKIKMARADAKAKGLPDPKPRKARAKKGDPALALPNPSALPAMRETIPPIDGAPRNAVNAVSAMPVDPEAVKSKPIDVPNLPGEGKEVASKKDIVQSAEDAPKPAPVNGISSTGEPKRYNDNEMMLNKETGDQVISVMYPGQKESVEQNLKANKKNDPLTPKPNPKPANKTTKDVIRHVPDVKAVEARAPFSYSAVKKLLYQ